MHRLRFEFLYWYIAIFSDGNQYLYRNYNSTFYTKCNICFVEYFVQNEPHWNSLQSLLDLFFCLSETLLIKSQFMFNQNSWPRAISNTCFKKFWIVNSNHIINVSDIELHNIKNHKMFSNLRLFSIW